MKVKNKKIAITGAFLLIICIGIIMLFLNWKSHSVSITEGDYTFTVSYEKQSFNHSANIEVTAILTYVGDKEDVDIFFRGTPFFLGIKEKGGEREGVDILHDVGGTATLIKNETSTDLRGGYRFYTVQEGEHTIYAYAEFRDEHSHYKIPIQIDISVP